MQIGRALFVVFPCLLHPLLGDGGAGELIVLWGALALVTTESEPQVPRLRFHGTPGQVAPVLMTKRNWGVECYVSHSSPKQGLNGAPHIRCRCRSRSIALPTRARESAPRDDKVEGGYAAQS